MMGSLNTLRWRHNGRDNDPNHQPHGCLLKRLFRRKSRKTSKLRVTGLCVGNSPGTGEFPAQMASNAENVSIWWRHHENVISLTVCLDWVRWRLSKEKPLILPMTKKPCCSLPTECVSVFGVAIYSYCDGCGFIDILVLVAYCKTSYRIVNRGPDFYSLCGKTSYRQLSWSPEAARLSVIVIVSHWNLTGISAAFLPRCLSNFRAIEKV